MTALSRDVWVGEVNTIIGRLFAIGLALAYDGEEGMSAHVVEARDGIDCLIRDLRSMTFNDGERRETSVPVDVERLIIGLDELRATGPDGGTVAYEDAVRAVCRATVALTEVYIATEHG